LKSKVCILALGALLSTFTSVAYGQAVNATLLGTVTDSSGASVANAKVTATEVTTGVNHPGQTNGSGNYTFPDMPPGAYEVTVEAPGFKKEQRKDITVLVDRNDRNYRRATAVTDRQRQYR
jgi:protocatechuate 3,4-dioxygenase beta subunit